MRQIMAGCLAEMAGVAAGQGDLYRVVRLLGKVDNLEKEEGITLPSADRKAYALFESTVRSGLGST